MEPVDHSERPSPSTPGRWWIGSRRRVGSSAGVLERQRWHALDVADVVSRLNSSLQGLTSQEAARRLEQVGPNLVRRRSRGNALLTFLRQLNDPLIWVLIASTALAMFLGKINDGLVVAAVVVINSFIGFVQEYRAGRAIAALTEMVPEHANALRDATATQLPVAALVPGDVVTFAPGDRVPADLRLIASRSLMVEEAALTGESGANQKSVPPVVDDTAIGDRTSMVYGGTLVAHGTGTGLVVATGEDTELGQVAELLNRAAKLRTPLAATLARIGQVIAIGVVAVAFLLVLIGTARALAAGVPLDAALADSAIFAITLAVGAIPEGLPAIVTVSLAIGVRRMAARGAIVRVLPAIETLGSTTVICSDKTGTLTRNEMTVQCVVVGGRSVNITGVGYEPTGVFVEGGAELPEAPREVRDLLRDAALVSDATLERRGQRWLITGDPTEAALVVAAHKAGIDVAAERFACRRLDVIPFEAEQQFMAVLRELPDGRKRVLVKGAPEIVVARTIKVPEGAPVDAAAIEQSVSALAEKGLRVLAIAAREWSDERKELRYEDIRNLAVLGLVGMTDPPRQEAIESVRACHSAGITVKMITGDHRLTATAIGRQLGLLGLGQAAILGTELEQLSDADLRHAAVSTNVFARVAPVHKLRLVGAMQQSGAIVAMTGDGVNDAPALKQANIGVAMGLMGTSVAKEAADIVLTDDNFATITAAVEEGRRVYENLVKALAFVLPTNLGLALILMFAVAFFPFDEVSRELLLPIQPTQILWINLIASVALAVPLAFEVAEPDVMSRPPRDPKASPLSGFVVYRTAIVAVLMAASATALWIFEYRHQLAAGQTRETAIADAQTMSVSAVVFFQMFYLLECRSLRSSIRALGVFTNRMVVLGIAALLGLQALFIWAPFMHLVLGSSAISIHQLALAAAVGATILPVLSVEKAIRRRARRPI